MTQILFFAVLDKALGGISPHITVARVQACERHTVRSRLSTRAAVR